MMWLNAIVLSAGVVIVAVVVWLVNARVLRAIHEFPGAVTAHMQVHTTKPEPLTCDAPGAGQMPGQVLACMLLPEVRDREAARLEEALDYFQRVEDSASKEDLASMRRSVPNPFFPPFPESELLPSQLIKQSIEVVRAIKVRYHGRGRDDDEARRAGGS